MAVLFPTSLDTTTFPTAGTMAAETLATEPHSKLHGDLGTAIVQIETKLGINGSADTNSVDYKLSHIPGVPVGVIFPFAGGGGTVPTNFIVCDGRSLATTGTFAALFAVLSYSYGGSGANFNIPDLRGRVLAGLDNMGGTPASILSAATSLGQSGGFQTHLLTTGELPQHTHTIDHDHASASTSAIGDHTHQENVAVFATGGGVAEPTGTTAGSGTVGTIQTGAAGAHAHTLDLPATSGLVSGTTPPIAASAFGIVQPYMALNYIIRY